MTTGAITPHMDVAQMVLYAFWVFFAGLIWYLHRENKREGYPLEHDNGRGRVVVQGFPAVPSPKTFLLADGTTRTVPGAVDRSELNAERTHRYPGSPLQPTGNPLTAGVGPGSWTMREDVPDTCTDGGHRIQPLRLLPDQGVAGASPDPRGWPVRGADGVVGGTVVDLWADRAEALFRYAEVEVKGSGKRVLLPMPLARVTDRDVRVATLLGGQFGDVPSTAKADVVTRREEDRIAATWAAGTLYATPERAEPWI